MLNWLQECVYCIHHNKSKDQHIKAIVPQRHLWLETLKGTFKWLMAKPHQTGYVRILEEYIIFQTLEHQTFQTIIIEHNLELRGLFQEQDSVSATETELTHR